MEETNEISVNFSKEYIQALFCESWIWQKYKGQRSIAHGCQNTFVGNK